MARTGLIIDPGAGYAQITAPDGSVRFDTRDEIFHVLSKVNGAISRPAYSSSVGAVRTADIDLGAVDPNCTAVLGLARFNFTSWSSDLQLEPGIWYAVGGTIVFTIRSYINSSGNYGTYPAAIGLSSFVLVNGHVRYQEELSMVEGSVSSMDITYRLYCGTFT